MTTSLANFRPSPLIDLAKQLASHGSSRRNALQIALLSSSLWLMTQASSGAFLSSLQLESPLASETDLALAPNTNQTPPRNLEKRLKKSGGKRLNTLYWLNAPFEYSVLGQALLASEELDAVESEINSPADREHRWEPILGQADTDESEPVPSTDPGQALDLSPDLIDNSPVLQQWLEEVPDVLTEIAHDPSFRTRLRVGYSEFPSTDQRRGIHIGVEDVFLDRTGLTISGDYHRNGGGDRQSYGIDLRYYLLSLGGYLNVAPVVGYRYLQTGSFNTDGVNLGIRLLFIPSRTGAADISLTQTWVSPAGSEEVSITSLALGYAVTRNLRISTDIQAQNSPVRYDSRVGIALEWML